MAFDVAGARKAGYSDTEIADHLATSRDFDVSGARKAGYSDAEITDYLSGVAPKPTTMERIKALPGQAVDNLISAIPGMGKEEAPARPSQSAPTLTPADPTAQDSALYAKVKQDNPSASDADIAAKMTDIARQQQAQKTPAPASAPSSQVKPFDFGALNGAQPAAPDIPLPTTANVVDSIKVPDAATQRPGPTVDAYRQRRTAELRQQIPQADDQTIKNIVDGEVANGQQSDVGTVSNSNFDFETHQKYKDSGTIERGAVKGVNALEQSAAGMHEFLGEMLGAEGYKNAMADTGNKLGREADAIGDRSQYLTRNWEGAVSSIVSQTPGLAISALSGGSVPLLLMGMQQFGSDYHDGKAAGLSMQDATTRASVNGVAEIIGEKIGMPSFTKVFKDITHGVPTDELIKHLAEHIIKEVPGEELTTAIEFANDKFPGYGQNKQANLQDYLKQAADTLVQTVMQAGAMGATGVAGSAVHARREQSATVAADVAKDNAMAAWEKAFPKSSVPAAEPAAPTRVKQVKQEIEARKDAMRGQFAVPVKPPVDKEPPADELNQDQLLNDLMGEQGATDGTTRQAPAEMAQASSEGGSNLGAKGVPAAVVSGAGNGVDTASGNTAPGVRSDLPSGTAGTGTDAVIASPIDEAAHAAATSPLNEKPEPTEAQKLAGNYSKGHVTLHGLDISIENPAGSTRSGTDEDGKAWETTLANHYGYVKRTTGADGDQVDVFIGDKPESQRVFVVDQINPKTGAFDEHKALLGFDNQQAALDAYHANYQQGWQGASHITDMSVDQFKDWLKNGDTTKPMAKEANATQAQQVAAQESQKEGAQGTAPEVSRATQIKNEISSTKKGNGNEPNKQTGILRVAINDRPMPQREEQAIQGLRGARDNGVPGVAGELRDIPEGHRGATEQTSLDGQDRQQSRVRPGQRQVGDDARAKPEQAEQPATDIQRRNNGSGGLGSQIGRVSLDASGANFNDGTGESADSGENRPEGQLESGDSIGKDSNRQPVVARNGDSDQHDSRQDGKGNATGVGGDKTIGEVRGESTLSVGTTPRNAETITVRNGVVYLGKYAAQNFETGEDVTVPAGADNAAIAQALRDSGVLSNRQRIYGLPKAEKRSAAPKPEAPAVPESNVAQIKQQATKAKNRRAAASIRTADELAAQSRKTFLKAIKDMGGIKSADAADVSGEPAHVSNRMAPGLFRKEGNAIDLIAHRLHELGYLPDADYNDVDGGVQASRDLIGQALSGEAVMTPAEQERYNELAAKERELAEAMPARNEALADMIEAETEEHDDGLDLDAMPSMSEAEAMRALGFTEEEINGNSDTQESGTQAAEGAVEIGANEGAAAGAGQEGQAGFALESQSPEQLSRSEQIAKEAAAAKAKNEAEADAKAKADAERDGFALTGSARAADANPGQADIFSQPVQEKPASTEREPAAKVNKPRKGEVGMMLGSGEVVLTASGRETTPFPNVKTGPRSTAATLKSADKWLMQNALDEANARGDSYNARMFEASIERPQQADKDSAEEYLFGQQPEVVPSILKPLAPSANTVFTEDAELAKPEQNQDRLENFGEALPPARRAMAAKLDEALTDSDIASSPLSEIWPLAENDAIEDTFAAAVAHAARAEIPAKPRVGYKVKQWVAKVQTLRELAAKIVSGRVSRDEFINAAGAYSLRDWISKVKLIEQLPRDQWKRVDTVEERPDAFTYQDGVQVPTPMLRLVIDGQRHYLRNDGTVAGNMDEIAALLSDAKPEKRMEFEIRHPRSGGKFFINKKGDGQYRHLMEFDTVEEARSAIRNQYDALVAEWENVKARDNITERDLRSAENRPRVGKDHRGGRDVTPEEFQTMFGFRGGEFGKWVQQGKGDKNRQAILNSAFDALHDLADIVGVPPRAISLNGTLGIAFGSRGSGWASAHFEPSNLVINLTKTRGAGALAHEWFHALDNYFSRLRGGEIAMSGSQKAYRDQNFITHRPEPLMVRKDGRPYERMTLGKLKAMHEARKHQTDAYNPDHWQRDPRHREGVRPEVEQRFAALVEALNESPMTKRARLLDGTKSGDGYWSSTLERAARAFENYVQARMLEDGYHNDFLANVKAADETGKSAERYPYLMPGEIKPITEAFDNLFDTIETKETDSGVAMFSRGHTESTGDAGSVSQMELNAVIERVTAKWKRPKGDGIRLIAVDGVDGLPVSILRSAAAQNVPAEQIKGVFHKGHIYLVRSNLKNARDAEETIFHEAYGHFGARLYFGPDSLAVEKAMLSIWKRVGDLDGVRNMAQRFGVDKSIEGYIQSLSKSNMSAIAKQRVIVDELLAHVAGRGDFTLADQLKAYVGALRVALRNAAKAMGLDRVAEALGKYTDSELLWNLKGMRDAIVSGKTGKGDGTLFARTDPGNNDTSFARTTQTPPPGGVSASVPSETRARKAQRIYQDQFNRFTVIQEWLKENGVKLGNQHDVYRAEERMYGKIAAQIEDFREKRLQPLVVGIHKAGFNMGQIGEYLVANHAAERNAQIAKINPDAVDDNGNPNGSGMTDAEAQAVLAKYAGLHNFANFEKLAEEFRAITDDTKQTLLDAGIISKEMADAWDAAYQHYVPLRGGPADPTQGQATGKGLSVNGRSERRRAMGHQARDEWVVENIIHAHERAIYLAEKNRVGQYLISLAAAVPDSRLWTIDKPVKRKVLRPGQASFVVTHQGNMVGSFDTRHEADLFVTAMVTSANKTPSDFVVSKTLGDPQVAYMANGSLADNEVQVYVKGNTVRIQLNDPLLARAYKKMGQVHLVGILELGRQVNAFLSKAYTGLNPEFIVTNMQRDLISGLMNITGEEGAGIAAKTIKNWLPSLRDMLRYSMTGKASPWVKAYREDGGNTGAAYLSDLERISKDVQTAYAEAVGARQLFKENKPGTAVSVALKKSLHLVTGWIEHMNAAAENGMRVALYRSMVEAGKGRAAAAAAAKNSTVNFNRKGEIGSQLSALYLFANPSIQGTASMGHALFKGKHKGQAWVMMGALAGLAYMLALGYGDDDEWDEVPQYEKDRNLLMRVGDKVVKIAVPYGQGVAFALGNAIYDLQRGKDVTEEAYHMASSIMENLVPLNPLGDKPDLKFALTELVPFEPLRIFSRVANNTTGFGSQIMPESKFDEARPDFLKEYRNTHGTVYDQITRSMSKTTGGTATQEGAIDVSPETLKFLWDSATGGTGKFFIDGFQASLLAASGTLPELQETPIVRKFVREANRASDARTRFWDAVNRAYTVLQDFHRASQGKDFAAADRFQGMQLGGLSRVVDSYKNVSIQARDAVAEINSMDNKTPAEKRLMTFEVEKRERELYRAMVKDINRRIGEKQP